MPPDPNGHDDQMALKLTSLAALAARDGALVGLACGADLAARCRIERHICIDTTAAGGNAALLAAEAGVDDAARQDAQSKAM